MLTLTLGEELSERVQRGVPVLPIGQVPNAAGQEPGRPVRFVDPRGQPVGVGVVDPENEAVRVYAREPLKTFDPAFFKRRLAEALDVRRGLGLVVPNAAFRLIHGEGDGLGGFALDVLGDYGVLYCYAKGLFGMGKQLAEAALAVAGVRGVVVKLRPKGGVKPGQVKQEVVGETPPEKLIVEERGVRFEVHPLGGLNVGLFTDMREHRRGLDRFVVGRRVLNTFAYTGAISVAAARAGAAAVTSVDLSSGVLKWAMENFRLSGIDPEAPAYRFEVSDVLRFLKREREAGTRWDTVILDPPTFSAARSHAWSLQRDFPDLIAAAAAVLPEAGGFLWVSSNTHAGPSVTSYVATGLRKAQREGRVLELGGLPPDYPTHPEWPDGRYLEVAQLWVR